MGRQEMQDALAYLSGDYDECTDFKDHPAAQLHPSLPAAAPKVKHISTWLHISDSWPEQLSDDLIPTSNSLDIKGLEPAFEDHLHDFDWSSAFDGFFGRQKVSLGPDTNLDAGSPRWPCSSTADAATAAAAIGAAVDRLGAEALAELDSCSLLASPLFPCSPVFKPQQQQLEPKLYPCTFYPKAAAAALALQQLQLEQRDAVPPGHPGLQQQALEQDAAAAAIALGLPEAAMPDQQQQQQQHFALPGQDATAAADAMAVFTELAFLEVEAAAQLQQQQQDDKKEDEVPADLAALAAAEQQQQQQVRVKIEPEELAAQQPGSAWYSVGTSAATTARMKVAAWGGSMLARVKLEPAAAAAKEEVNEFQQFQAMYQQLALAAAAAEQVERDSHLQQQCGKGMRLKQEARAAAAAAVEPEDDWEGNAQAEDSEQQYDEEQQEMQCKAALLEQLKREGRTAAGQGNCGLQQLKQEARAAAAEEDEELDQEQQYAADAQQELQCRAALLGHQRLAAAAEEEEDSEQQYDDEQQELQYKAALLEQLRLAAATPPSPASSLAAAGLREWEEEMLQQIYREQEEAEQQFLWKQQALAAAAAVVAEEEQERVWQLFLQQQAQASEAAAAAAAAAFDRSCSRSTGDASDSDDDSCCCHSSKRRQQQQQYGDQEMPAAAAAAADSESSTSTYGLPEFQQYYLEIGALDPEAKVSDLDLPEVYPDLKLNGRDRGGAAAAARLGKLHALRKMCRALRAALGPQAEDAWRKLGLKHKDSRGDLNLCGCYSFLESVLGPGSCPYITTEGAKAATWNEERDTGVMDWVWPQEEELNQQGIVCYLARLVSWGVSRVVTPDELNSCFRKGGNGYKTDDDKLRQTGAFMWNWSLPLVWSDIQDSQALPQRVTLPANRAPKGSRAAAAAAGSSGGGAGGGRAGKKKQVGCKRRAAAGVDDEDHPYTPAAAAADVATTRSRAKRSSKAQRTR